MSRAARGGHPRYCAELAAALANRGAEVTLVEPAEAFEANKHLHPNGQVTNADIPGPSQGWFRQELAIGHVLRRRRKTGGIVVFHDTSPIRLGLIGMLRATTSWNPVTMVHNTQSHLTSLREQLKHSAARAALVVPHRVLVHNERQRGELAESPFVRATTIDVVPHGTWSETSALAASTAVRRRTNLLFFGVMRNNSGLDVLFDAAPTISNEFPEISIKIVGSSTSPEVDQQLAALATFDFIEVRSEFVSDEEALGLFAEAGLLLIPYTNYSSESGVLMQAIAHGVPVVSTPGTSVADRVAEFDLGPNPSSSFLDQLRKGVTAPNDTYAAWQTNLATASEAFRWDDHARILLDS